MQKAPKIGQRVRYTGDCPWGRGGVVRHVYPYYPDTEDPWKLAPEPEWSVRVEIDQVPPDWPYNGKIWAPYVSEVEPQ